VPERIVNANLSHKFSSFLGHKIKYSPEHQ